MPVNKKNVLHEMEVEFLKTFIAPKYYDRAYHELCSKDTNKRGNFFAKLYKGYILKKNCKIDVPHLTKEQEFPTIKSMLISHGANEDKTYILSDTGIGAEQKIFSLDV